MPGSQGTSQEQTPGERYDNVQVAKELAGAAEQLGLDKEQTGDLTRKIIGGTGMPSTPVGVLLDWLLQASPDAGSTLPATERPRLRSALYSSS